MKILVTRRITDQLAFRPKHVRIDWENKAFECKKCGTQFKLETADRDAITAVLQEIDGGVVGLNDFIVYHFRCPDKDCHGSVELGSVPAGAADLEEIRQSQSEGIFHYR